MDSWLWCGLKEGGAMPTRQARRRRRNAQLTSVAVLVLVFAVVIWIDLTTGLWQHAVILSGIAAGLLTFLLTALFFEQWMARSAHRRWFPVTHLALTDLLHALGDEERSEFSRGVVVPRSIDALGDHDSVLAAIHTERRAIAHALARWVGFLAASADVQDLMDRTAELPLLLDDARDAVLHAESSPADAAAQQSMHSALAAVNASIRAVVDEIEATLGTIAVRGR